MSATNVHICQCSNCQQEAFHPDKKLHHQMNLFLNRLDEQQSRWYVAMESYRVSFVQSYQPQLVGHYAH